MTSISQRNLARRFARGDDPAEIPPASNITTESAEGSDDEFVAYIVGYNWAMYAGRLADGSVVVFDGWYGYSQTTSKQMGTIKGGIRNARRFSEIDDFRVSDLAPTVRDERDAESNLSSSAYDGHDYPA